MNINRKAFTMIELVFVIVVLGILAAIAVPRLAATRDDAIIASGRANILAIRSGIISERQGRMFRGDSRYAGELDNNTTVALNTMGEELFSVVLAQPYRSGNKSGWSKIQNANGPGGTAIYRFHLKNDGVNNVDFNYTVDTGVFTCDDTITLCRSLTR